MEVIFCDNHLLAVHKPAGIASQPDFEMEVQAWVKKEFSKPHKAFAQPIHRLDKPVSGLMLFARTSKALERMNEQMRARLVSKIYLALVEGEVTQEEGVLEHSLIHSSFCAQIVSSKHPEGKKALLRYRVLGRRKGKTYLSIELCTGRYHQIRAQLAEEGHPIVGDQKYGSQTASQAIALHSMSFQCEHPVTREKKVFYTPPRLEHNPFLPSDPASQLIWQKGRF